jgi:hypothetical protein
VCGMEADEANTKKRKRKPGNRRQKTGLDRTAVDYMNSISMLSLGLLLLICFPLVVEVLLLKEKTKCLLFLFSLPPLFF